MLKKYFTLSVMRVINFILDFIFSTNVVVYAATKMTGRDKLEQVKRAEYLVKTANEYGVTLISPVLEEHVTPEVGKLVNRDKDKLRGYWNRDKEIIVEEAHVVFMDHAEMKSFGMERELGLNRYCLWKPTVLMVPVGTPISVAEFEDDYVFYSAHHAFQEINRLWGCRWDRWKWRSQMLIRTLPKWIYRQILAWR